MLPINYPESTSNNRTHWLSLLLVPLLISGIAILLTLLFAVVIHRVPQLIWNFHAVTWTFVALCSCTLNRYLDYFLPMLWVWIFWFSLQSELAMAWRNIDAQTPTISPQLDSLLEWFRFNDTYYHSAVLLQAFLSPSLYPPSYGRKLQLAPRIILTILILVTIHKPRVPTVSILIYQTLGFFVVYWSQHFMVELENSRVAAYFTPSFEGKQQRPLDSGYKILAKVIGSIWMFYIQTGLSILGLTLVQLSISIIYLLTLVPDLTFDKETCLIVFCKTDKIN